MAFTVEFSSRAERDIDAIVSYIQAPDRPLLVADCCCGTGRMLLAAANINPHVELVGQDIDARCAKITAVNLGLRGRYGWVVCGNALSGETQFAYRIGSFFNEVPGGRRRGVIREVAPELTPVPVIAQRMRRESRDLFQQPHEAATESQPNNATIIEVPQWLARLEPKLETLNRDEPAVGEERSEKTRPRPEGKPPNQQELF